MKIVLSEASCEPSVVRGFSPVRTHCVAFTIRLLKGLGLRVFLVLLSQSRHVSSYFHMIIMQFYAILELQYIKDKGLEK